jgi:hypothetical protein
MKKFQEALIFGGDIMNKYATTQFGRAELQ